MKAWIVGALVFGSLGAGLACGEEGPAQRACLRFLRAGELAPRPRLKTLGEVATRVGVGDPAQGPLTELVVPAQGSTQFTVAVDAHDAVVSYNAFDRALRLSPKELEDPERALAARTRYSERELQRRARVFFSARTPGGKRRRWTRVEARLCCDMNPVWYQVRFLELAPEGALAVYPNQVVVGLNPESGEVVFYRASHVRERVTEAPAVDAEAATLAGEALCPGARFEAPRLTLAYVAGELRAEWSLLGADPTRRLLLHVDAETAEARVVLEQPLRE